MPGNRVAKLANAPELGFRNRNEKEFAGYRDAIDYVTRLDTLDYPTVGLALHLHRLLYRHTDGRGGYLKDEDNEISDRDEHGRRYTVFHPVGHQQTAFFIHELMTRYEEAGKHQKAHPLVLLAAFIVDFLAIHPVIDGNGRVARLLTAYELLRLDYGVSRYASIEQRIYETKNSYYAALEASQRNWHHGSHSIWPWAKYLLEVLAEAYDDFEARVAAAGSGLSKQERVRHHVLAVAPDRFTFRDVTAALPGISAPTIRKALTAMRDEGLIRSEGKGAGAVWIKVGDRASVGPAPI